MIKKTAKFISAMLCCIMLCVPAMSQDTDDIMMINAIKYIGIPYVAHTLETDEPEELVVNCDEVDCLTLVEYVLAESLCPIVDGDVSEVVFGQKLQMIRYRDGKIDGYPSRLHYIAEWVENGVRHGFLEDVTAKYSQDTETLYINYMSTHPERYKQLSESPENVNKIKQIEESLSGKKIHYLPENKLPDGGLPWIKNGDIIAITTNIPGLDVAHMGIAFRVDDKLTLLHASSEEGKVVVSDISLAKMLKNNKVWTGIRVLRMKK